MYSWHENREIYGHIRCKYTVLADPSDSTSQVLWVISYVRKQHLSTWHCHC